MTITGSTSGAYTSSYTSPTSEHGEDLPTQITDPHSVVRSYVYDDFSRLLRSSSNDFGTMRWEYASGRLVERRLGNGKYSLYSYDFLGRRSHAALALLTAIASGLGCGADRVTTSDGGSTIEFPECANADVDLARQFVDDFAHAFCQGIRGCLVGSTWWSIEDCMSLNPIVELDSYFTLAPVEGIDAVANGRARFDRDAAAACIDFLSTYCLNIDYDGVALKRSACSDVFVPTECASAAGFSCAASFDCADGLYCPGRDTACDRPRCTISKTEGEPCSLDKECESGFHCLVHSFRCGRLTVAGPSAEGQPCLYDAIGELEAEYRPCLEGLVCARTIDEPYRGTCVQPVGAGEECEPGPYYGCVADHSCEQAADGVYRCLPPPEYATEGEECGEERGCDPRLDLVCDLWTSTCMAVGDGSVDTVCVYYRRSACNDGYYCHELRNRCEPTVAIGEPCATNRMCDSVCCEEGVCGEGAGGT